MLTKLSSLLKEYRRVYSVRNSLVKNRTIVHLNSKYQSWIDEVKAYGYIVIPNFYSKEKCQEIIAEIESIFEEYPNYIWRDDLNADCRIYGAERLSSKIKEFHSDSTLHQLATAFNEVSIVNSHTLAGKITSKPNNLGSGQGWHRDTANPFQFKALLYLTDVDEEHGPFQYLKGSHYIASLYKNIWRANMQVKQTRFTEEEIERLLQTGNYSIQTLTAKAGALVLVNTFGIHRGKPISTGTRFALTNYYMSEHTYKQEFMEKKFNLPKN